MSATTIAPKWTIRNDEWVQVYCEIIRGPNGLSDLPISKAIGPKGIPERVTK